MLGQVIKFARYRNSKILVGYYLDNISNIDSTAAFLGLEQQYDLIEDFCSVSIKRDPNLRYLLPAKNLDKLKQYYNYIDFCEQIENLSAQITAPVTEEEYKELKAQQYDIYNQQQKLIDIELANYYKA